MEPKQSPRWSLTSQAFDGLLTRLGPDRIQAGQEYERLRQKLFSFFDWRGSSCPDTHVDETLDRIARRLDEGEKVESLYGYAYGVARRVLSEWERNRRREGAAWKQLHRGLSASSPEPDREQRLACLERCLRELPDEELALIREYYPTPGADDLGTRQQLAGRLGMRYGTLKTRAHRVRVRLEACLRHCLASEASGTETGFPSRMD